MAYYPFKLKPFYAKNISVRLDHKEQPRIIALTLALKNYPHRNAPTEKFINWVLKQRIGKKKILGTYFAVKYYMLLLCLNDIAKWEEVSHKGKLPYSRYPRWFSFTNYGRENKVLKYEKFIKKVSLQDLQAPNVEGLFVLKKLFYSKQDPNIEDTASNVT